MLLTSLLVAFYSGKPDTVKKKAAYRPSYGKLGELRSLAGPHVPIVALTATASLDTRNMILNDLCMKNSYQLVIDPDKRNIKYCVVHAKSDDICHNFEWLINLLRTHGPSMPRMIIFFRQIKHISEVYEHLETSLGTDAYVNFNPAGPNDDRNRLFDMFHMKTDDDVKDSICSSYHDPKGTTRVVLSSTSFSMGLDVKGVDTVLHYGPANDMDDYLQETGRAGRCAEQNSHAVLIKYKRSTSSTNITKDMKLYVNTSTVCRRTLLLTQFVDKPSPASPRHTCCDVCSSVCKCLCNCEEDCVCDNVCPGHDSMVVREMNTTYAEDSNTSSDASDCDYSSDTDVDEYLSRQPQILQYSSEED